MGGVGEIDGTTTTLILFLFHHSNESDSIVTPAAISALARGDLDNALVASTPGGIERQEKRGQQQFVASDELPRTMRGLTQANLEALGFKFDDKQTDDLFIGCTMPDGWKKVATEHHMWSHLLDDKGRKRASIFYKAAFYDRSAHMDACTFYNVVTDYLTADDQLFDFAAKGSPAKRRSVVRDANGSVLFETDAVPYKDYAASSVSQQACSEWLDRERPQWKDCLAYWN